MPFQPVTIPSVSVLQQMQSRVLTQFGSSPVFQGVVSALASEIQALEDAIRGVMQAMVPANAGGVQEDAIGRIVGEVRGVTAVEDWFTPDTSYYGQTDTINPVWVDNAPLSGTLVMDDVTFRQYIYAKVQRNFVQNGSITDIQDFIYNIFGINSSVIVSGMEVTIKLPAGTSPAIITFLNLSVTNNAADTIYILPLPPGVQLAQVTTF